MEETKKCLIACASVLRVSVVHGAISVWLPYAYSLFDGHKFARFQFIAWMLYSCCLESQNFIAGRFVVLRIRNFDMFCQVSNFHVGCNFLVRALN